jgi:restriction system protein
VSHEPESQHKAGLLPSFPQLMLPVLQLLGARYEEISVGALEEELVRTLRISSEERARMLPSGAQTVLANRLNWARAYLSRAGLIEMPRRGHCLITQRGRKLLGEDLDEIDIGVLERYPEFVAWRTQQKAEEPAGPRQPRECPEETMASSFEMLNCELAREIVQRVHSFSPAFFERLIVDLLVRMGYGGGRQEMGRALGRVGDGGVDGVIKEDALGLDVVYVQAKRLDPEKAVPVREVRDFVGGLEGHRATKGVFVTTSYFPSSAYDFITRVSKRVVLIDGPELASLMIRHRVGVRVKDTYEVKKIDEDYFVE